MTVRGYRDDSCGIRERVYIVRRHRTLRYAPTCCYGRCCSMCPGGVVGAPGSPKGVGGLPGAAVQRNFRVVAGSRSSATFAIQSLPFGGLDCFETTCLWQQNRHPLHDASNRDAMHRRNEQFQIVEVGGSLAVSGYLEGLNRPVLLALRSTIVMIAKSKCGILTRQESLKDHEVDPVQCTAVLDHSGT